MILSILVIGLCFSLIGAVMAFLITYEEYSRHYPNKRKPFRLAIMTAIFAFSVFSVLSILSGMFLSKVLLK